MSADVSDIQTEIDDSKLQVQRHLMKSLYTEISEVGIVEVLVSESILIVSTISLIIELVALGLVVIGYWFKRVSKYRQHGILMASALGFHIIAITGVMVPSLVSSSAFIIENPGSASSLLGIIHSILGSLAAILGAFLVGLWRFKRDARMCFRRKRIMDETIILWTISFLIGIYLYMSIITA